VSPLPRPGGHSSRPSAGVLASLLLVAGCSLSNSAPDPLSPAGFSARAERALEHAWAARNWTTVEQLLSPEVRVRLPGGEELHGHHEVIDWMRLYQVAGGEFVGRRMTRCTGHVEVRGSYFLRRFGEPLGEYDFGSYLLVWEVGPGGPALREAMILGDREEGGLAATCRPMADSLFHERKIWAAVHVNPTRLLDQPARDLMASSLEGAGWVLGRVGSGRERSGGVELVLRFPLVRDVTGDLSGYWISGRRTATKPSEPNPRQASVRYSGVVSDLTVGFRTRGVHLSAGPSLMYLSGSWSSSVEPSRSWDSWALGSAIQASYYRSSTSRVGSEIKLRHRYLPEMAIPGYMGSDPPRMGFHEVGLSFGLGVRPW
jgi:hypothetical protein